MPRWDYDTVFYRVFCFTLLGIACAFTVILTNVFIDIDGLLYKKNEANTDLERVQAEADEVITTNLMPEDNIEKDDDYKDYGDTYDMVGRTKRSLETQDISFRIKDPKVKKVITERLAALLEDLDKKENSTTNQKADSEVKNKFADENSKKNLERSEKYKVFDKAQNFNINNFKAKDIEWLDSNKKSRETSDIDIMDDIERLKKEKDNKQKLNPRDEELKHLAVHNIILQGIIGHTDLGDVYTRVHSLMNKLENTKLNKDNLKTILRPDNDKQFFNELMNCKLLKEQIHSETTKQEVLTTPQTKERVNKKAIAKHIGRNIMVKTIIDISSIANEKTYQNDAFSKENVNGLVKLIYNGKSLNFRRVEEGITTIKPSVLKRAYKKLSADFGMDSNIANIKEAEDRIVSSDDSTYISKFYINKIISEYLKKYSHESESLENTKKLTTKRLKRNIKIRYKNDEPVNITTKKPKLKGDNELYVEIETHFDSKGLIGEKKKKMIRELIKKIQTAIQSKNEHKKKIHTHLHVKKRTQNPINYEHATLEQKLIVPLENLMHRELDPISKYEQLPYVTDDEGDGLSDTYYGPRYFSSSKAINSAEMSEVDTDYNKLMENGIPQRLQQPINTDSDTKTLKYNHDPLNSKFILKNIGGSGFAVGFNQYVDDPPDAESINLFSGIENILKTYHQKYDEDTDAVNAENTYPIKFFTQKFLRNENFTNQEYSGPETHKHTVVRRATQKIKQDYHSNENKVIYNKNFLNFDNYKDVLNVKRQWSIAKNGKQKIKRKKTASVLRNNIFKIDLKPSEILSLADLLDRNKRSIYIEKISKVKNKKKYINTKSTASKKIFQQNRRSKRQINKIRIIAKDLSNHQLHNSEEDIFVLSDEKIFADRAVVKEAQSPYMEPSENINNEHYDVISPHKTAQQYYDQQKYSEDHYNVISPQKEVDNHYDFISPYILEPPQKEADIANEYFARRSRHNSLMSKYPHVFMQEISRSKEEEFSPENLILYDNMLDKHPGKVDVTTQSGQSIVEIPQYNMPKRLSPILKEIVNQFPLQNKGNYKVTVKIMPKNNTDPNTGFKETHTTFNKTYNKNGLVYTSLVNVSEISKVETINNTNHHIEVSNPNKLKIEHLRMKSIIQQHKDRIKEQLSHLNIEKQKLDLIDSKHTELMKDDVKDYIDVVLPNHPGKTLHLTKEDLNSLFKLQETKIKVEPITVQTTTVHIEPVTENPDKLKIFKTIERNEHMTNEILKKIDKNTDILQRFLNKIFNKLERQIPLTTEQPVYQNSNPKIYYEQKPTNTQIQRTNQLDEIPDIIFNKISNEQNGTRGIPFIYAFQHPYTMSHSNNKDVPIASVVYQGHIHANVNNNPEQAKDGQFLSEKHVIDDKVRYKNSMPVVKNNKFEIKNDSKFFIDDLESEFKVMPTASKAVYSVNLANDTKA